MVKWQRLLAQFAYAFVMCFFKRVLMLETINYMHKTTCSQTHQRLYCDTFHLHEDMLSKVINSNTVVDLGFEKGWLPGPPPPRNIFEK